MKTLKKTRRRPRPTPRKFGGKRGNSGRDDLQKIADALSAYLLRDVPARVPEILSAIDAYFDNTPAPLNTLQGRDVHTIANALSAATGEQVSASHWAILRAANDFLTRKI